MGIVEEDIARVRSATDFVALAGEHLALRRVGTRWVGLCPFHTEKSPSFSINAEIGMYYCFGCGAKGKGAASKATKRAASGTLEVLIGTMIETPRAALRAEEIAEVAEFFSFGTNDLTQMTFGFSRDDVEGRMMSAYLDKGLLKRNPFETIDQPGVGQLVLDAVSRGRSTRADLKLGVCGEHGGDPESIDFFYRAGLDYVSCSPFRVPIARLAAAQAVISNA